jgi:hypothetical protein
VRVVHADNPGTLIGVPQDDATLPRFAAATAVRRTAGHLAADLDPGWDVGGSVLNGGYLLAVVARAAVLESPHPHPVAVSASFLRATGPGAVSLTVTPGPAGRTLAHSAVALADADGPTITAQVTTAALDAAPPVYSRPMPEMPPVEDCVSTASGGPDVGIRHKVETWLDPSTVGWAVGKPSGEPVMRAWVRLADESHPDPFSLLLFADVLPPTSWSIGLMGWAPTVQLQALVRALPAPGWCLVEAQASEAAGGWIDEDYRIWDSTGRLVAQSRQLARLPR